MHVAVRTRTALGVTCAALLVVALAACSDGGRASAGDATSSSTGTPFEERDAALRLSSAATGMNLVAGSVSLQAAGAGPADYCSTGALPELEPHRATLEAAAEPAIRRDAATALADLHEAIELCAAGKGATEFKDAIDRYNTSFEALRKRIADLPALDR
ncbi:MAG TPA: hypothetical protein VFO65_13565 [Acidimicrobiales bacterium]|nr:hypothetical protein [Acidimicrobiales bacterium]